MKYTRNFSNVNILFKKQHITSMGGRIFFLSPTNNMLLFLNYIPYMLQQTPFPFPCSANLIYRYLAIYCRKPIFPNSKLHSNNTKYLIISSSTTTEPLSLHKSIKLGSLLTI